MRYRYDKRALPRLMLEKGFSVPGLAEKSSLTRQAVADLKRGAREPKAGTIAGLSTALGVSPAELFCQY